MIKGWKLNPEWVRLMDEKNKAMHDRKMQRIKTQHDLDMLKLREMTQRQAMDYHLQFPYGFTHMEEDWL